MVDPIDVLVSCKMYPSTGGLAFTGPSFWNNVSYSVESVDELSVIISSNPNKRSRCCFHQDQVPRLAKTLNDALNDQELPINGNGGLLKIMKMGVSDKNSGDIGHPIQYIGTGNTTGWYVNVSTASTENTIYSTVASLGTSGLGETSRTFVNRRNDNRV